MALAYAVFATIWIFASDEALLLFISNPETLTRIATVKGILFVAVTALLLFVVMGRNAPGEIPVGEGAPDRRTVAVSVLGITGSLLIGAALFWIVTSDRREQAFGRLSAIADIKIAQVSSWIAERRADARYFQAAGLLAGHMSRWLAEGEDADALAIRTRLATLRQNMQADHIALLDREGRVQFVDGRHYPLESAFAPLIAGVLQSRQEAVVDLRLVEGMPQLAVVTPFAAGADRPALGVAIITFDARRLLFPLISAWPLPSASGDALIARRDGDSALIISDPRGMTGAALHTRVPLASDVMSARALRGLTGVAEALDYRGVPVLGAARKVEGTDWVLVVKEDRREVLGTAYRAAGALSAITVLALLGMLFVLLQMWRQRQIAFAYHEREQQIRSGALVAHFRQLADRVNDIVLLADEKGTLVDVNDRAVAAYGKPREALIGQSAIVLRAPEIRETFAADLRRILDEGLVFESTHCRADGTRFPVELSARAIDVGGRRYVQAIVRDLTDLRRAERELRESEARFRQMAGAVDEVFWITSADSGSVSYVNPAFERVWGEKIEALYADPGIWKRAVHPDDVAALNDGLERLSRGEPLEMDYRIRRGDGEVRWIHDRGYPVRDAGGRVVMATGVAADITERKTASAKALELEAVVNRSPAIFFLWRAAPGWPIEFVSENIRRFGYAPADLLSGRVPYTDLVHPDDLTRIVAEADTQVASGIDEFSQEYRIRAQSGEWRWIDDRKHVRRDGNGRVTHYEGEILDITTRKETEQQLAESESRIRAVLDQSIAAVYTLQDGHIIYANPRMREIFGYGPGEPFDTDPLVHVHPGEREKVARQLAERLSSDAPGANVITALRKDGIPFKLGINARRAVLHGRPAIIAVAQDVTEKERAQQEVMRYVERLERAVQGTIEVVSIIGELRDPYTHGHERRVGEIAAAVANEMGLEPSRVEGVRIAGYLHDVGKISVPAEILSKPGRLTAAELALVREHAQLGYEILNKAEFPWPVAEAAWEHHERFDGSGYPRGLSGEAILPEARILAVADTVEAMASHRPYRAGLGIDKALAEIERGAGTHYDPQVAAACLRLFRDKGYQLPD